MIRGVAAAFPRPMLLIIERLCHSWSAPEVCAIEYFCTQFNDPERHALGLPTFLFMLNDGMRVASRTREVYLCQLFMWRC